MSVITALIIILCAAQGVGSPPPRAEMPTATLPPLHLISPPILSRGDVREVATAAGFRGQQLEQAVSIAWCESRFNVHATGQADERGLWQIHPVHLRDNPAWYSYDVVLNARAAYELSSGGRNWRPWTCAFLLDLVE